MFGFGLEHPRVPQIDLNLLFQIIILAIILVSLLYKKNGKIKLHGTTMGIAVVIHVISYVLVMGPSFFQSFTFFSTETGITGVQTAWLHALPGAIALMLGVFLVAIWVVKPSNVAPCYKRKRIMDVTIITWIISLIFGIATYILFYA